MHPIEADRSIEPIIDCHSYAASRRSFAPYRTPFIFERGDRTHLWNETGNEYTDPLCISVCISVGHLRPAMNRAIQEQRKEQQRCTTMFRHPVTAHFADELVAHMPAGHDWVVHLTNSGAEAIEPALVVAPSVVGNINMPALRNAHHGAAKIALLPFAKACETGHAREKAAGLGQGRQVS